MREVSFDTAQGSIGVSIRIGRPSSKAPPWTVGAFNANTAEGLQTKHLAISHIDQTTELIIRNFDVFGRAIAEIEQLKVYANFDGRYAVDPDVVPIECQKWPISKGFRGSTTFGVPVGVSLTTDRGSPHGR